MFHVCGFAANIDEERELVLIRFRGQSDMAGGCNFFCNVHHGVFVQVLICDGVAAHEQAVIIDLN
ncbi:hypothetical protein D3C86_2084620 [compost metagenome]